MTSSTEFLLNCPCVNLNLYRSRDARPALPSTHREDALFLFSLCGSLVGYVCGVTKSWIRLGNQTATTTSVSLISSLEKGLAISPSLSFKVLMSKLSLLQEFTLQLSSAQEGVNLCAELFPTLGSSSLPVCYE